MSDDPNASLRALLLVGPSHDGLWIVRDCAGVCGAVFTARDAALRFARSECEAMGFAGWRLVASLDLPSIFSHSA
jgi:hypothetical protein